MRSGNMVVCGWHDTKRLTMFSTVDNNLTIDKEIRSKQYASGKRTVEKPVAVERCNMSMVGVDRFDQMLGTYQCPHKSLKWYHTLYHRARRTALVNGYIIYKKASEENKEDPQKFRQAVIDKLLEHWTCPLPLRMTGKHFPTSMRTRSINLTVKFAQTERQDPDGKLVIAASSVMFRHVHFTMFRNVSHIAGIQNVKLMFSIKALCSPVKYVSFIILLQPLKDVIYLL